jgi:predicted nuclease of predicted toxin-antitoxin system
MLRFLLDENVPKKVKEFLESMGYVAEYSTRGLKNSELASIAISGKYVLVTRDSDFTNTILYPPGQFHGIIVLRVHPPRAEKLIEGIAKVLAMIKDLDGKLIIIRDEGVEIIEGKT